MKFFGIFSTLASVALATSRTSAPAGALVVSKSASSGQYSTISEAVKALSSTSTSAQSIFIEAGTYSEQVYIPALKSELTVYGYTSDTATYSSNVVSVTAGVGLDTAANDDATATVRVWTENVKFYNINFINTRGDGSQALAISAYAGVRRRQHRCERAGC